MTVIKPRKTGGRQKGTPNKRTAAKRVEVERMIDAGLTPLEYMLGIVRDTKRDDKDRIDAARSAAPYVHPRLTAIEHTGRDGKDLLEPVDTDKRSIARAVLALLRQARTTGKADDAA